MKNILSLLCCLFSVSLYAQNFNVSLIPDSLKKNANVVKRFEEIDFEIKSPGKATVREHHAYTILNDLGEEWANYHSGYDKFTSINYIDGILYNEDGKELKHVKKKDMADESGSNDETLMSDTRYKVNNFYNSSYPFTVEYDEEDDIDGILDIEPWMPVDMPNMSVQFSKYVITVPKNYELRYKVFNFSQSPVITQTTDKITYTWQIQNVPAIEEEKMAPSWSEIVPNILFAPSDFEIDSYKGNMNTWQNFGKFILELNNSRDILPDNIKESIHNLTGNLKDTIQKINAVYNFLQQNTRYINIKLGIGGWQPFDANYVATKKYGDCKALSNFTVALLKEAGIKADYVLIAAGEKEPDLITDFPCTQFNHATVCIPLQKDSIWLECTSQTESPGFAGDFTGDRKALLIDENGGHIVCTPVYTSDDNSQIRNVDATIDANGNLDANVVTTYSGIQEELPHSLINDVTKDQRDKYLNYEFNLPTYEVDKSSYSETKGIIPKVTESLHLISPGYANISGRRLFIVANLFNKSSNKLSEDSVRKFDIVYNYAFKDVDSVHIKIPDGYILEALPKNINLESKFGIYHISFSVNENNISCVRTQIRNRSRFPATDYKGFVEFTNAIYKADRSQIVLIKKES